MTADTLANRSNLDAQFDIRRTLRTDREISDEELRSRILRNLHPKLKADENGRVRVAGWRVGVDVTPINTGRDVRFWGYLPYGNAIGGVALLIAAIMWFSFSGMSGVGMLRWMYGLGDMEFTLYLTHIRSFQGPGAADAFLMQGRLLYWGLAWIIPFAIVFFTIMLAMVLPLRARRIVDETLREL